VPTRRPGPLRGSQAGLRPAGNKKPPPRQGQGQGQGRQGGALGAAERRGPWAIKNPRPVKAGGGRGRKCQAR
jgi:hypothetical protein